MSRGRKGFTIIELLVVIGIIALLAGFLLVALGRARDEARRTRCQANLGQIAKAMALYMARLGDNNSYLVPAATFRGDAWIASLYWTGIVKDPKVFFCPASNDRADVSASKPADLSTADAVAPDAMSYAGLCKGTALASRNTRTFAEPRIPASCAMACDDNEGSQNHSDGFSIVFFDTHVEFRTGTKAETYDLIGASGSPYSYLDSGE